MFEGWWQHGDDGDKGRRLDRDRVIWGLEISITVLVSNKLIRQYQSYIQFMREALPAWMGCYCVKPNMFTIAGGKT